MFPFACPRVVWVPAARLDRRRIPAADSSAIHAAHAYDRLCRAAALGQHQLFWDIRRGILAWGRKGESDARRLAREQLKGIRSQEQLHGVYTALERCILLLHDEAAVAKERCRVAKAIGWTNWAAAAIQAGAGRAHAYLRQAQPAAPPTEVPGLVKELRDEHAKWNKVWSPAGFHERASLPYFVPAPEMARMTVDDIRKAALGFRDATSLGAEGLHPRAVALLSDPALKSCGISC